MRRFSVCSTVVALAGLLTASSVQAQTPAAEGAAPPATSTATASFTGASSSRGRGIGVGAITMLNGTSGLLVTWGTGSFHVDGFAGLHHYRPQPAPYTSTTDFGFGGRFWYHIHAASFADFSAGGGIGFNRWVSNPGGPGEDSHFDVSFEVGAQIRAFIVPNVALIGDLGLGATFGSNDNLLIGGQSIGGGGEPEAANGGSNFMLGSLGIAYFFE